MVSGRRAAGVSDYIRNSRDLLLPTIGARNVRFSDEIFERGPIKALPRFN